MASLSSSEAPGVPGVLGRVVRHEMFSVYSAALLSALVFCVLTEGYLNSEDASVGSWPFAATVIPLLLAGLAGVFLARGIRVLPWLWTCCLAAFLFDNIDRMDGQHRCVWCDDNAEVVALVTAAWVGVAGASRFIARRRQTEQASHLAWLTRSEVLAVLVAAALYGISYYALRWGYNNFRNSEFGPWPVDPTIIPFSVGGLIGVYLTRKRRRLPWIWISLLVIWTVWNFSDYWVGHFFVDGQRGCVLCDEAVLTLWLFSIPWMFVAFATWLAFRPVR